MTPQAKRESPWQDAVTLRDFQLAMLHPMCDRAPAQAANLLRTVGATRPDTAAAEEKWWQWSGAQDGHKLIGDYVAGWGTPDSEEIKPGNGREICFARWDLTFWPELLVELTGVPHMHQVFIRVRRRPEIAPPRLASLADLTPWSCTDIEFDNSSLGAVRPSSGQLGPRRKHGRLHRDRSRFRRQPCLPGDFRLEPAAVGRTGARRIRPAVRGVSPLRASRGS
ncbi:hypothetical protein ACFWF7_21580 [Nocardia sp. NPDC060256]|uniref:hypothetical protein n=1 Tax=unclassified Nocardia TaxID=2637762 RepID=UPI00365B5D78